MMEQEWKLKETDSLIVKKLADELNVSMIIATLLVSRGIKNFDQAKHFFRPKLSHLYNPFLMKDMLRAVKRIERAIKQKEKILVYGDYDVDGTTSVAMMYSFLKKYNNDVEYYIPCRYSEGYGISFQGIDYAHQNKVSLIVALDCGIRAFEQVNYAKQRDIDFIICDHHNPAEKIPKAHAVLNPKQYDCNYPYKDLSGCGVGFKLIHAYCINNTIPIEEIYEYLDLLAVSIGADIVPIDGENRVLAFYGMKKINLNPRTGLKTLIDIGLNTKDIKMSDIIFGIAPRINAAGRIDHAIKAVDLLVEQDYNRAKLFVKSIEENNQTRKELQKKTTNEAIQKVNKEKKSIVLFSQKWHKGVVGIVASRIVEKYYKPTIVLSEQDGMYIGSARSVNNFDIYQAISKCSDFLEKFGGHKYAAGLSVKKENLEFFINAFEIAVSELINEEDLHRKIQVDMEIDINDVDQKLYRILQQFAPFGPSNSTPIFISKRVVDSGYAKTVGSDHTHLKINIKKSYASIPAIGFGLGVFLDKTINQQEFDICYSIGENQWQGNKELQLILNDIK